MLQPKWAAEGACWASKEELERHKDEGGGEGGEKRRGGCNLADLEVGHAGLLVCVCVFV